LFSESYRYYAHYWLLLFNPVTIGAITAVVAILISFRLMKENHAQIRKAYKDNQAKLAALPGAETNYSRLSGMVRRLEATIAEEEKKSVNPAYPPPLRQPRQVSAAR